MNTALFKQVDDIIKTRPAEFDMHSWEGVGVCGTTRCLAGWGIHLTTGAPLFGGDGRIDPSVTELAERLEVDVDFAELGAAVLDIDDFDASVLFYAHPDTVAQFVSLVAQGRESEAVAYLDGFR